MFPDIYKIIVIHDLKLNKVIGCGSLICEKKFIRSLGTAAHIEDIVVREEYRGKNLGLRLIELLKKLAVVNGCYKTILDCEEKNIKFYEKVSSFKLFDFCLQCEHKVKGVQMAWYAESTKQAKL